MKPFTSCTSFEVFTAHTDIEVSLGDLGRDRPCDGCQRPCRRLQLSRSTTAPRDNPEPVDDLPAAGGLVYSATANCEVDPVGGTWSVSEGTGFFSAPTEFNTFLHAHQRVWSL